MTRCFWLHFFRNISYCTRITIVFIIVLLSNKVGYCQAKQEYPYKVLDSCLSNTCFPDSLYGEYDYKSFFEIEKVKQTIDIKTIDYGLLNAAVFYATNEVRDKRGRKQFVFSSELRDVAFFHSFLMVKYKFYSHVNHKDKRFRSIHDRLRFFKVNYIREVFEDYRCGENIYNYPLIDYKDGKRFSFKGDGNKGTFFHVDWRGREKDEIKVHTYESLAKSLVKGWMKSKGHRKSILRRNHHYLGAGVVVDYNTIKYRKFPMVKATQLFSKYIF